MPNLDEFKGEQLKAFKCNRCGGKGEVIVDWNA